MKDNRVQFIPSQLLAGTSPALHLAENLAAFPLTKSIPDAPACHSSAPRPDTPKRPGSSTTPATIPATIEPAEPAEPAATLSPPASSPLSSGSDVSGGKENVQSAQPESDSAESLDPDANAPESVSVELSAEDARDQVLVAVVASLIILGNRPSTPKELAAHILRHRMTTLGGKTPYATVSSRISQHFKRSNEKNRAPILGKIGEPYSPKSKTGQPRKWRYYVDAPGIAVGEVDHSVPQPVFRPSANGQDYEPVPMPESTLPASKHQHRFATSLVEPNSTARGAKTLHVIKNPSILFSGGETDALVSGARLCPQGVSLVLHRIPACSDGILAAHSLPGSGSPSKAATGASAMSSAVLADSNHGHAPRLQLAHQKVPLKKRRRHDKLDDHHKKSKPEAAKRTHLG
ncbi:uncharacterized protein BJ171DRAFT_581475 [Polychytrium aggregatum]|uniref:uncharacterized protein n=1 Tax=Polychytrium aggregatum TaxID=110093 RepID=UPI0022FDF245|nr:uncharacterized protein BJ171DRAFT_581475 [Polychytrium aggregatum]KAI9204789.1 hypothetical protein BJ171DRAFT_581475 [Polychytrium aggregatum]